MTRPKSLILAAALAAAGTAASAQLALESVHWQAGRVEGGRVPVWKDAHSMPGALKPGDRVRARLVLKNTGAAGAEGILLRYSLTARVLAADGPSTEGAWAIPFVVEEKRVPKIGADKTIEVPFDAFSAIDLYLRRLTRSGWRPDRIKIQVMLEPHRGSKDLQIVEDSLDVERGAKP